MTDDRFMQMMNRIRTDIIERVRKGTIDYKRDMGTLEKHLSLAEETNNQPLIVQTYNAIGLVELELGHFERSEEFLKKGYEVIKDSDDDLMLGRLRNNVGEVYRRRGQFQPAIEVYEVAFQYFQIAGDLRGMVISEANLGLVYLEEGDYNWAKAHFEHVLKIAHDTSWNHVGSMIESNYGLAEIHLQEGDFSQAWQHLEEAEQLAIGGNLKLMLADVNITKAHIAEQDQAHEHRPAHYYALARETLNTHSTPIRLAQTLLKEARYQQRMGHDAESQRLATEALGIFQNLGRVEHAALAQAVLSTNS